MSHVLVAERVANALSVAVEADQSAHPGNPVVVLESMKLEIPVVAAVVGTNSEIVVAAGAVARDGDPLVAVKNA